MDRIAAGWKMEDLADDLRSRHKEIVERYEAEISDLKHQLSKSIEREQEIERELDALRDAWRELRREHGEAVEELQEERARADALAGALDGIEKLKCDCTNPEDYRDRVKAAARIAIEAHRQAREK